VGGGGGLGGLGAAGPDDARVGGHPIERLLRLVATSSSGRGDAPSADFVAPGRTD
jgi:hypothetical protein